MEKMAKACWVEKKTRGEVDLLCQINKEGNLISTIQRRFFLAQFKVFIFKINFHA